jgi:hypothetical protein
MDRNSLTQNRRFFVAAVAMVASLSGCAVYQPPTAEYAGPTATIRDNGFSESSGKVQIYAVTKINGALVRSSFGATANASMGPTFLRGPVLNVLRVPAQPLKVEVRASHLTAAPIQEIFHRAQGNFFSVEGTVEFTPQPGGVYEVVGKLGKEKSSVWIQDVSTGKPVTAVIEK